MKNEGGEIEAEVEAGSVDERVEVVEDEVD